ncbi:chemotaxis-specific protein-glutamate methyltransferase CheB [Aureliella helgolandensis]|uniref:Protein-glutamate methylesterase/protein-glutamine glutaminase n=1 Tax=Aureliella helgolandensis TaxID=2527968 RepID=A0A518G608_9BACT|nr:chemotaxis-specific protein-glutamate methyltransferase CheB [Aureliella helgolandensis]QDV23999.1 Chemotaxis response regulator protein-glutamate methylesterase [Aureliella helgolandensis]
MKKVLRCIVADVSPLSRKIVRAALEMLDAVEVVGTACDGISALQRCQQLEPDLLTLDVELPGMSGIEAVQRMQDQNPNCRVIMISSLTSSGAAVTNAGLEAGAFDFIVKPIAASLPKSVQRLGSILAPCLDAVRATLVAEDPSAKSGRITTRAVSGTPRAVCIGVSTGGPLALSRLLPQLPSLFPVPIFVVQHMPPFITRSLAQHLSQSCELRVVEASDGMKGEAGTVYVAPGGRQMGINATENRMAIVLDDAPPECNARPSVDYLFRSLASSVGGRLLAVVMTGMGEDGVEGCRSVRNAGGYVLTQDAVSCVVYGMPKRVVEAGMSDYVGNIESIASQMTRAVGMGGFQCI